MEGNQGRDAAESSTETQKGLCTKNRVEMEVFPLRPSAYLCVLCVNGPFNAESAEIRRGRRENKSDLPLFLQSTSEVTSADVATIICHSARRAIVGFTFVARRAGM